MTSDRARTKKQDLSGFPVDEIKRARENDFIYEPFGIANDDDAALLVSIRERGIQEPLTISVDGYLLSGHRRLAAATMLKMTRVPARVVDIVFSELSKPERLELLRLHNRQRDKSPGEQLREALVGIDPKAAYVDLLQRRAQIMQSPRNSEANVVLGDFKRRARITTMQFLKAACRAVEENRAYWPMTDRRLHYLLLNDPPLRHDKKPGSRYVNDKASYKALTDLLIRARLTGDIPMKAIEDSTRPVQVGGGFDSLGQFVHQETENFLMGYTRNLMMGQPHHLEIMLEKNALRSIVEAVAADYCIPVTTGRGFSSLPPRYDMYRRFKHSGKSKLVLLMLTDFDPDGEQIAASFARSMRDDFGVENIHAVKVALTADDVRNNNLPSDMDAKPTSPNYQKFLERFGTKAVELDAAPVTLLQSKLRQAITNVIDVEEFNAQVERERIDAASIQAHRMVVLKAIQGAPMDRGV